MKLQKRATVPRHRRQDLQHPMNTLNYWFNIIGHCSRQSIKRWNVDIFTSRNLTPSPIHFIVANSIIH